MGKVIKMLTLEAIYVILIAGISFYLGISAVSPICDNTEQHDSSSL